MPDAEIRIWPTIKEALNALLANRGYIARLSLVFIALHSVLWSVTLPLWLPSDAQTGGLYRSLLSLAPVAAVQAISPAYLVTALIQDIFGDASAKRVLVWRAAYVQVFWRIWVLTLLVAAGGGWLESLGYYDPAHPEGPPAAEIATATILALAASLLALRLSPAILAAALGRRFGFGAAWRSLEGAFLRYLAVFVGVYIPLTILANVAWIAILGVSLLIEEHLVFLLIPVRFALVALALALSAALVLGVTRRRIFPAG